MAQPSLNAVSTSVSLPLGLNGPRSKVLSLENSIAKNSLVSNQNLAKIQDMETFNLYQIKASNWKFHEGQNDWPTENHEVVQ